MEAKTAVWIVSEPRAEHVSTIAWLNETSPASFYLLKVEAIQIASSRPAPLLTLVVGPSEEGRRAGSERQPEATDGRNRVGLQRVAKPLGEGLTTTRLLGRWVVAYRDEPIPCT